MDEIRDLLLKYKAKGVLVDSNLLLVYFVGMYDPSRVTRFKRTKAFSIDDFDLLARVLQFFCKIVTTPNILTEVNSFSNQLPEETKFIYYREFARQINLTEDYLESNRVSALASFERFGLTDLATAELAQGKYLVLSDDLRLIDYLHRIDVDAINFNHLRTINWGFR